jgi:hypothetical protein
MASRKNLKKDINYLTFELLTECYTFQYFHKDSNPETINKIATEILDNRNDLISRINHIDGKLNPKLVKAHFNKIRKDYEKSVEELDKLEKLK